MLVATLCAAAITHAATPVAKPAPKITPKPGKIETWRDWTIGCDNGGRCEAVSLMAADANPDEATVTLGIIRDAGPSAPAKVWLTQSNGLSGTISFFVDGVKVASAVAGPDRVTIDGPQAAALAIAAAHGNRMEVRRAAALIGRPSLSGAAAALRYMDAQQGRAGTTTALIAAGSMGPDTVDAPSSLPVITRVAVPAFGKLAPLWREELVRASKIAGCSGQNDTREADLYPLSKTQTLVLVPCGSGAYNFSSAPMIATGTPGRRLFTLATFDFQPGWTEDNAIPILVNATWDAAKSQLGSYAKGRGIGDCGGSENYVWDGAMFRLVRASAMGECRGARHWITTWRARVTG